MVKGQSDAEHKLDILATMDEGIVTHRIVAGIEASDKPVEPGNMFDFDVKAYDIVIQDKGLYCPPHTQPRGQAVFRKAANKGLRDREVRLV